MPHIVAASYRPFETPAREGACTYEWFAAPLAGGGETLVGVRHENEPFLLRIKPKDDRYIIKADKITRPAPLFKVKEALEGFCRLAECERISDNIASIRPSHAAKAQEYHKSVEWFVDHFPAEREVWIEVGFGSGRHLLHQAKKHPKIQFIGIEIHKPSIEQLLGQIALQGIENILVVDYDARLFLELVPSNLAGKIFVHFPVPWDKKPHRRVISAPFITEACRVLGPGGVLELRTDSDNYFRYAFELFMARPSVELEVTKNIAPPVTSKYEDRWRRLGKDIYDIRMYNRHSSPPKPIGYDFAFEKLRYDPGIIERYDRGSKVFGDYFVHFQKLYRIDDERLLAELSFGSFERPTHAYILIGPDGADYFAKRPVPTGANIKAHKKIEELLYG